MRVAFWRRGGTRERGNKAEGTLAQPYARNSLFIIISSSLPQTQLKEHLQYTIIQNCLVISSNFVNSCCKRRAIADSLSSSGFIILFSRVSVHRSSTFNSMQVLYVEFYSAQNNIVINTVSLVWNYTMSLHTLPFVVFNLGCEMLYVLEQRLSTEREKSQQVLTDIVTAMFEPRFIYDIHHELQPVYSLMSIKALFSRLAHVSFMRLTEDGLEKVGSLLFY